MNLTDLIAQGTANPLAMIGLALLLGGLHGLEPGHSKTMMAAFIIAVRGTASQAVILGLSAALSHTLIVWILALVGLSLGDRMIAEDVEPWFMMGAGVVLLGIASWVFAQTWRSRRRPPSRAPHHHGEFHAYASGDHVPRDAHVATHAREIETRFASGRATTGQVATFGLTGGLIPCPAAVTVLILCLHLQKFWLGVGIVGAFSAGLAVTLVAVGVAAAWGMSAVRRRTGRVDALFAKAPYVSAVLIAAIGVMMLAVGIGHAT